MANYLDDREFLYEIIISKGKGKLTQKAERFLILVATNVIKKKERQYTYDDKNDFLQQGMLVLFSNWQRFDSLRFTSPLNFFTEVFKRSLAETYHILNNQKSYQKENVRFISIDRSNEGKGLHSF